METLHRCGKVSESSKSASLGQPIKRGKLGEFSTRHLGASQSDLAHLQAEDINWRERVISFARKKTGTVSLVRFGDERNRKLPGLGTDSNYINYAEVTSA